MKNKLFSLLTLLFFTFFSNAQGKDVLDQKPDFKIGSIVTTFNKEVTEYKFKSLEALIEGMEAIIKEIDLNDSENKKGECEMLVELKIEITIGISSVSISEIIKTNCTPETADIAVKKFKALISAALIG